MAASKKLVVSLLLSAVLFVLLVGAVARFHRDETLKSSAMEKEQSSTNSTMAAKFEGIDDPEEVVRMVEM